MAIIAADIAHKVILERKYCSAPSGSLAVTVVQGLISEQTSDRIPGVGIGSCLAIDPSESVCIVSKTSLAEAGSGIFQDDGEAD